MTNQSVTQRPESINPASVEVLRSALLDQEDLLHDMEALNRAAGLMCDADWPAAPNEIGAVIARLSETIRQMKKAHDVMCSALSGMTENADQGISKAA